MMAGWMGLRSKGPMKVLVPSDGGAHQLTERHLGGGCSKPCILPPCPHAALLERGDLHTFTSVSLLLKSLLLMELAAY